MWIDYTFGSGWPFGGGFNITPELASLELRSAHRALQGPSIYEGEIPWPVQPPGFGTFITRATGWRDTLPEEWRRRLKQREQLVAVIAVRGQEAVVEATGAKDLVGQPVTAVRRIGVLDSGTAVVLTGRVGADRRLRWEVPPGSWQLFSFVQFPADLRVLAGVGAFPQLVLDHFKREALESHIRAVGEEARKYLGQYFGTVLRALFCDSLELAAWLFWTDTFFADFQRLRGYDLTPFLPVLKEPGYDMPETGSRVRHDYWRTVSDLLIENFYQPFADWAEQNGMLARVQAHGAPADVLRIYGLSHIPETESLYAGGRYDFLKFAASAAHVYGRPITASESFVWIGQEYQTTPEKIKRYADELLTAGVNQIVYGGFPYEYMDRPEPGWYPFVSPLPYASHVNHHDPFWEFLAPLNDYITRVQYLSRVGRNVAPVAVFRSHVGYEAAEIAAPALRLDTLLLASGYNFDHINEHALLQSRVEQGRLISPGGASYDQLVFLGEERMALELVERLAGFARAGLPILFVGRIPDQEIGLRDHAARSLRIQQMGRTLLGVGDLAAAQASGTAGSAAVRLVPTVDDAVAAVHAAIRPNLRFLDPVDSVSYIQKRVGRLDVHFIRNGRGVAQRIRVGFPRGRGWPEIWDPWTGETALARDARPDSAGVALDLRVEPFGSRLLVFDPAVDPPAAARPAQPTGDPPAPIAIGGGEEWTLRAEGRGAAGTPETHELRLAELVDWSRHPALRHFSGKGRYRIDFTLDRTQLESGFRAVLDLGAVGDVAEVTVNGRPGPTLLLRPYRADVTALLREGKNELEVTVTNALLNRLLGSGMPLGRVLGTFGRTPDPLPAGLLGPVRLELVAPGAP
jgi:hypothetical protein